MFAEMLSLTVLCLEFLSIIANVLSPPVFLLLLSAAPTGSFQLEVM